MNGRRSFVSSSRSSSSSSSVVGSPLQLRPNWKGDQTPRGVPFGARLATRVLNWSRNFAIARTVYGHSSMDRRSRRERSDFFHLPLGPESSVENKLHGRPLERRGSWPRGNVGSCPLPPPRSDENARSARFDPMIDPSEKWMFSSRAVNPSDLVVSISLLLGIEFEFRIERNGMEWDRNETKRNETRAVGWMSGEGKKLWRRAIAKWKIIAGKGGGGEERRWRGIEKGNSCNGGRVNLSALR